MIKSKYIKRKQTVRHVISDDGRTNSEPCCPVELN